MAQRQGHRAGIGDIAARQHRHRLPVQRPGGEASANLGCKFEQAIGEAQMARGARSEPIAHNARRLAGRHWLGADNVDAARRWRARREPRQKLGEIVDMDGLKTPVVPAEAGQNRRQGGSDQPCRARAAPPLLR
jgi:hypothetical protein